MPEPASASTIADKRAPYPLTHRNPVTPGDIIATLCTCLGIDPNLELTDRLGRLFVLAPWGTPIRELLA